MTEDKRLALLCQLLSCSGVRVSFPRNPTHGSGWIVQTQPTKTAHPHFPESHPRQWVDRSSAACNQRDHKLLAIVLYGQRLNLKYPPTAVGGITRKDDQHPLRCRNFSTAS